MVMSGWCGCSFARALGEDPIDPSRLSGGDVVGFVAAMQARFSPCSMKAVRTALRSFFRFLRVEGLCDEQLELAIPRVAHWRLSTLPRYLSDGQLARVLASLDASTPCGRRDRAIVLCLASLGLRPGEIAKLRLEDIDWRAGSVLSARAQDPPGRGRFRCRARPAARSSPTCARSGRRPTSVACSCSTAESVAAGRSLATPSRRWWFVRFDALGFEAPLAGAYVFRHTVASRLVRRGASLKEVADFLGHRSLDTTAIYAKLDLEALREVALPWPRR